jgi:hypothetical protein
MYENFRLEYQVVHLEYVHKKLLKIEAVCLNPFNEYDREAIFKYSTNNFNIKDERLKISFALLDSVAKNLNLDMDNLYKLIVKNNKVFYIYAL